MCLMVLALACSEASHLFFVTWLSMSLWQLIVCCNLVFEVVPITLRDGRVVRWWCDGAG